MDQLKDFYKKIEECQKSYQKSNYIKELSWKMAAIQKDQIRPIDFRLRVSSVVLLTAMTFKAFRGLKKLPITIGAYYLYRNFITPELNEPQSKESEFLNQKVKEIKTKIGF
jgi:hypothetical protein